MYEPTRDTGGTYRSTGSYRSTDAYRSATRRSDDGYAGRGSDRPRGERSGRSTRPSQTRPPQRRSSQQRPVRSGSSAARRRPSSSGTRRNAPQTLSFPWFVTAAVLLVSVLSSVLITRCSMQPKIDAAVEARKQAESTASQLKNDVTRLEENVRSLEAELKNAGVESPWTASGKFATGNDALDKEVKEFCDAYADKNLSRDDAAFELYKTLAWADYVERDNAQYPAGPDWRITYARQYFENDNSGNCYEFAAALMYCLRYLGYEDAVAQGIVLELQSGDWGDHGIVFVTNTDGSACMCDTARGTDGWMISQDAYNYMVEDLDNRSADASAQ